MEPRVVEVLSLIRDAGAGDWTALGTLSRYGLALRWEATLGVGDGHWNVVFPRQTVGEEGESAIVLVYDGDPSAADDVRSELNRRVRPSGTSRG